MCTPASVFAVIALRALPPAPRPPAAPAPESAPDPARRQGLACMLPALLAWLAAGRERVAR